MTSQFINLLDEIATKRLSDTFKNLDSDSNYEEYYYLIFLMSKSLNQWMTEIFIEKSSSSIYFMDKSIIADSLMIENIFLNNEDKNGDVEFFLGLCFSKILI